MEGALLNYLETSIQSQRVPALQRNKGGLVSLESRRKKQTLRLEVCVKLLRIRPEKVMSGKRI